MTCMPLFKKEHLSKVALLGFSDGANLAMVFCFKYPELVSCLILNSGNTDPKGGSAVCTDRQSDPICSRLAFARLSIKVCVVFTDSCTTLS